MWLYLGPGRIREIDSHLVGTLSVSCSDFPLVSDEEQSVSGAFFFFLIDLIRIFYKVLR